MLKHRADKEFNLPLEKELYVSYRRPFRASPSQLGLCHMFNISTQLIPAITVMKMVWIFW
jgi:hypothetical protein